MLRPNRLSASYPVDPDRRDLVDEFFRSPSGPHSPELQKLLHRLRWTGEVPRFVLLELQRGNAWQIGKLPTKPGDGVSIHSQHVYTCKDDAEREVFRIRWEALAGVRLGDQYAVK